MTAQSFLAKNGMRSGIVGSSADLAIAAPLSDGDPDPAAHTDANRMGWWFDRGGTPAMVANILGTDLVRFENGKLDVLASTASSNPTTGALVVAGGAGLSGRLSLGSNIVFGSTVGIAIGADNTAATLVGTHGQSIAIGSGASITNAGGTSRSVVIGWDATAEEGPSTLGGSVAIGAKSIGRREGIAIGRAANAGFNGGVAIGKGAVGSVGASIGIALGLEATLDTGSQFKVGAQTGTGSITQIRFGDGSADITWNNPITLPSGIRQSGITTVTGAGGAPDATADGTRSVYLLDGGANTCTLNLPAAPSAGRIYYIKSTDSTNTVTIGRNGNNIDGAAADVTLATNEATVLVYDSAFGWAQVSELSASGGGGGLLVDAGVGTQNYGTTSIGAMSSLAAGASNNIAIGNTALSSATTNDGNLAIGDNAGQAALGNNTIAIGLEAAQDASGGNDRVVIGVGAYKQGTGGSGHIAIGRFAGRYGRTSTTTSESSIAIGYQAMQGSSTPANNTGIDNTAIGYQALTSVEGGSQNIGIGNLSLAALIGGDFNVSIGDAAGTALTSGSANVTIGYQSLTAATTAASCVAVGHLAATAVSGNTGVVAIGQQSAQALAGTGDDGVFIGRLAGSAVTASTNGEEMVAVGYLSYGSGTGGRYHVALGAFAMRYGRTGTTAGESSIAIGYQAMQGSSTPANNTGHSNIAIGDLAANQMQSGSRNIVIGNTALDNTTTGSDNVVVGDDAATLATVNTSVIIGSSAGDDGTLTDCVFLGYQAADAASGNTLTSIIAIGSGAYTAGSQSGGYHIAIGDQSMSSGRTSTAAADHSIGIGSEAVKGDPTPGLNTGTANIGIGYQALTVVRSGSRNLAIGNSAAASLAVGDDNVFLGDGTAASLGTSGSDNVVIGAGAYASGTDGSRLVIIGQGAAAGFNGSESDAIRIGFNAGATSSSGGSIIIGVNADTLSGGVLNCTVIGNNAAATTDCVVIGDGSTATASGQLVIGSAGASTTTITDVYIGGGVTSGGKQNIVYHATGGTGTDIAGSDITIAGGQGTGTGAGGQIFFQTAPAGSTGSSQNALATVATITESAVDFAKGFVQSGKTTITGAGGAPDATADGTTSVYLLDGGTNTCTLNLDASPTDGQRYEIKSIDSSNTVTIGRNGNNIDGVASDQTLATNESVTLIFDSTFGWAII